MLALMQMAKTTLAVRRFHDDGRLLHQRADRSDDRRRLRIVRFQADVIVAEARAAIGFAGRRVIEQTIRQKLPDNFQTAEFLLEKGAIDMVVERKELKDQLVRLLDYGSAPKRLVERARRAAAPGTVHAAPTERRA